MANNRDGLILRGPRVFCQPFTVDNISDSYLAWLNDPVVNQFSRRRFVKTTRDDAIQFLTSLKKDEQVLGIFLNEDGKHVGNIQYGPIDWVSHYAEIRIVVGERRVWGQGIGTAALYLVTKYLFESLKLHRVEANTCNPAFKRCVEKLGWIEEGKLRERFCIDDQYHDFFWFGMLSSDFKKIPEYEALRDDMSMMLENNPT